MRKEAVQGAGRSVNKVVRGYLREIYTLKAVLQVTWRVWKKWGAPIGWGCAYPDD
ncbi:MAG: hypothetical protein ACXV2F_07530 [Halobacteriota archaeon]